jgi:hypothetical protein
MSDYRTAVREAIEQYLEDNEQYINMADFDSAEDFGEWLNDTLWTEDSVTGNGSGSYFCNSAESKEAVLADVETALEAIREFDGGRGECAEAFLNEAWEFIDVTARCYVLGECIADYISENEEAIEEAIEEAKED